MAVLLSDLMELISRKRERKPSPLGRQFVVPVGFCFGCVARWFCKPRRTTLPLTDGVFSKALRVLTSAQLNTTFCPLHSAGAALA